MSAEQTIQYDTNFKEYTPILGVKKPAKSLQWATFDKESNDVSISGQ